MAVEAGPSGADSGGLDDFGYYTAAAEWGGFGKSGNGRELGPTGLAEYQELKHIWHNTAPKPAGWFKG